MYISCEIYFFSGYVPEEVVRGKNIFFKERTLSVFSDIYSKTVFLHFYLNNLLNFYIN